MKHKDLTSKALILPPRIFRHFFINEIKNYQLFFLNCHGIRGIQAVISRFLPVFLVRTN